jgi:hypothetical protein
MHGVQHECDHYFPSVNSAVPVNKPSVLRFEFLTAASIKIPVFCIVASCSLVEVYRRFRCACCLPDHRPDDGGSKNL